MRMLYPLSLICLLWLSPAVGYLPTETSITEARAYYLPLDTDEACEAYHQALFEKFAHLIENTITVIREQRHGSETGWSPVELVDQRMEVWRNLYEIELYQNDLYLCAINHYDGRDKIAIKTRRLSYANWLSEQVTSIRALLTGTSLVVGPADFENEMQDWIEDNIKENVLDGDLRERPELWMVLWHLYETRYVSPKVQEAKTLVLGWGPGGTRGRNDPLRHILYEKACMQLQVAKQRKRWFMSAWTEKYSAFKRDRPGLKDIDIAKIERESDFFIERPVLLPQGNNGVGNGGSVPAVAAAPANGGPRGFLDGGDAVGGGLEGAGAVGGAPDPPPNAPQAGKRCTAKGCWQGIRKFLGLGNRQ